MQGLYEVIFCGFVSNYMLFVNDVCVVYQNVIMCMVFFLWFFYCIIDVDYYGIGYVIKDDLYWNCFMIIFDSWGLILIDIIGIDWFLFIGIEGIFFVNVVEIMCWEGGWYEVGVKW